MRPMRVLPKTAQRSSTPRNVLAASTMTAATSADLDACRDTLVGRTFGVERVEVHGDGDGFRIYLGRSKR